MCLFVCVREVCALLHIFVALAAGGDGGGGVCAASAALFIWLIVPRGSERPGNCATFVACRLGKQFLYVVQQFRSPSPSSLYRATATGSIQCQTQSMSLLAYNHINFVR